MEAQNQLSPSTLLYLFADQFAEPPKGLLPQSAIAPRTGEKVNAKTLVKALYLSAIMELVESGTATLETIEVKKLFGKESILALSQPRWDSLAHPPDDTLSALLKRSWARKPS